MMNVKQNGTTWTNKTNPTQQLKRWQEGSGLTYKNRYFSKSYIFPISQIMFLRSASLLVSEYIS